MKRFFLLAFLFVSAIGGFSFAKEDDINNFQKKPYVYKLSGLAGCSCSPFFEMIFPDAPPKKVIRTASSLNYFYDLFGQNGREATGIQKVFSFGMFSDSLKQIEIYDNQNILIGKIIGSDTGFALYDQENKHVANACLRFGLGEYQKVKYPNNLLSLVAIVDPESGDPIAFLHRFSIDTASWTVTVHNSAQIDERVFHIFNSFVADLQHFWKY
jgi:hypothetical protein